MFNDRPHKKLILWSESMELVTELYRITNLFPKEEEFGLKNQLRRAAVSIPSNIAEGLTRMTMPDKKRFLIIANGSLSEIDTQLDIASRLKYISETDYDLVEEKIIRVEKLLGGLIRKLNK